MTSSVRATRRARIAVSALFLTNGAIFASLVPRYPEIKAALELSNTVYGILIALNPVGAMLAGVLAAVLIRRFGSARVAVFTSVGLGVGVLGAALSPSIALLAMSFLFAGAMDAITDVAQNAHGLRVQRRSGRTIINSLHAIWSAGAVTGGAIAAGAIAIGLPLGVHIAITSGLFAGVALLCLRWLLPGPDQESSSAPGVPSDGPGGAEMPRRSLVARIVARGAIGRGLIVGALVLVAIGGGMVEDIAFSWAALYIGGLGAPAAVAASGFIGLVAAQFIGRLVSDRLTDLFGARAVTLTAGLMIAGGIGLAIAVPTVPGAIIGFALAGFGSAPTIPLAMQEADRIPGLREGTGLTIVTWLMRVAFLLSPPVIGAIADAASLRAGLGVTVAGGVLVIVLSWVLPRKRDTPSSAAEN